MASFRALLSVSDKRGLENFAAQLVAAGGELIASGGTAHKLEAAGIPVLQVEAGDCRPTECFRGDGD